MRTIVTSRRDAIAAHLREAGEREQAGAEQPSAKDLVFALRDEFYLQAYPRQSSDTPVPPPVLQTPGASSPHTKLITEGPAAAGALIDALADTSLTRCVLYRRVGRFGLTPCVQTVGALAEITLQEIAGFRPELKLEEVAGVHPGGTARQAAWRSWLADAERRGVDEVLAENAQSGSAQAVDSYVRRHPDQIEQIVTWLDRVTLDAGPALRVLLRATREHLPKSLEVACRRFVASNAPDSARSWVVHDLLRFGIVLDLYEGHR